MREDLKKPMLEVVRILGIALAVYLTMRYLLPMVIPFLIAFFLAKLLYPVVEKLHKKLKMKKGLIAIILFSLFLVVLLWVLWLTGRSLLEQLEKLLEHVPVYQKKIILFWEDSCARMEDLTGLEAGTLELKIIESTPQIWDSMKGTVLPSLMNSSFSWLKGIAALAAVFIVVGVSTLLVVKEYGNIYAALEKTSLGRTLLRVSRRVYHAGGGYVKAQLLIMALVSAICVIGLFCTGNPYAMLAGMGIGFCDALPFLGTGTIFIPWAIIEILSGRYLMAAVYAVIYTIANLARELLEPKLVGDKLGIHPLAVVISIYMGICIYGLWGFALGPLTYILVREIWREIYGTSAE